MNVKWVFLVLFLMDGILHFVLTITRLYTGIIEPAYYPSGISAALCLGIFCILDKLDTIKSDK